MSRVLPILFNTDMVRAILDGRKTVTRRCVKPKNKNACGFYVTFRKSDNAFMGVYDYDENERQFDNSQTPPCQPGDILYVRETFSEMSYGYEYKADGKEIDHLGNKIMWRPSIHMPKEVARIWLKVTNVRVERLQDITEEQAIREGIIRLYDDLSDAEYIAWSRNTGVFSKEKEEWGYKNYLWHGNFGTCGTGNKMSDAWEYQYSSYESAIDSFSSLYNTTVPLKEWDTYGWDANPWVWVIAFERCKKPNLED